MAEKKLTQAEEIAILKEKLEALEASDIPKVKRRGPTKEEAEIANELVPITIPKDRDHMDDVVVMVNGKAYQIQRGKSVEVPRFVAEVIWNSWKQEADTADYVKGVNPLKRQFYILRRQRNINTLL